MPLRLALLAVPSAGCFTITAADIASHDDLGGLWLGSCADRDLALDLRDDEGGFEGEGLVEDEGHPYQGLLHGLRSEEELSLAFHGDAPSFSVRLRGPFDRLRIEGDCELVGFADEPIWDTFEISREPE